MFIQNWRRKTKFTLRAWHNDNSECSVSNVMFSTSSIFLTMSSVSPLPQPFFLSFLFFFLCSLLRQTESSIRLQTFRFTPFIFILVYLSSIDECTMTFRIVFRKFSIDVNLWLNIKRVGEKSRMDTNQLEHFAGISNFSVPPMLYQFQLYVFEHDELNLYVCLSIS